AAAAPPPGEARASQASAGATLTAHALAVGHAGNESVLADLDLVLPAAGLVVISGPSGSGKTTLLRTLLGLLPPVAGEVRFAGRPLHELDEYFLRRNLAYVPQGHELLSGSVREALAMGRGVPDERVWAALGATGMADAVRAIGGLGAELG